MRSNLLYRRNPLAYPAGVAPGFDPNHPAANGISGGRGISVVPINGNFVDLTTGTKGAISGTPTSGIRSDFGPNINFVTADQVIDFSGKSTSVPGPGETFAAIVYSSNTTDFQCIITKDLGGTNGIFVIDAMRPSIWDGAVSNLTSFTLVANTPYFLIGSTPGGAGAKINFLALDLRSGVVVQETVTGGGRSLTAGNGTYRIGGFNLTENQRLKGPLAAAMYSTVYLSPSQLRAWADDPWAFWYPRQMEILGAFTVASAAQYATFGVSQDDGRAVTQMIGY